MFVMHCQVLYWFVVFFLAFPNHVVLQQIIAWSLTLPSIIVHAENVYNMDETVIMLVESRKQA